MASMSDFKIYKSKKEELLQLKLSVEGHESVFLEGQNGKSQWDRDTNSEPSTINDAYEEILAPVIPILCKGIHIR